MQLFDPVGGAEDSDYRFQTELEIHERHPEMTDVMIDFNIHDSAHHIATEAPSYDVRSTEGKRQEVANTDCESLYQNGCCSQELFQPLLLSYAMKD